MFLLLNGCLVGWFVGSFFHQSNRVYALRVHRMRVHRMRRQPARHIHTHPKHIKRPKAKIFFKKNNNRTLDLCSAKVHDETTTITKTEITTVRAAAAAAAALSIFSIDFSA